MCVTGFVARVERFVATVPLVAVTYSLNRPETSLSINIVATWIRMVNRNKKHVVFESICST